MVESRHRRLVERTVPGIRALSERQDAERLRLAFAASRAAAFDWTIADDKIVWDGARDVLQYYPHPDRLQRGEVFRNSMSTAGRAKLASLVDTISTGDVPFEIVFEAASAMGSVWLLLRGTRVADAEGKAERLAGLLRVVTEQQQEMQRLLYLATRDELTGHLNRNALRGKLSESIEAARAGGRNCAFLVASIDRLAMINDAYGFDAADEVIVAVAERLAQCLRNSDVIGRTAGNKFGMVLSQCSDRETTQIAQRLRIAIRDGGIETRAGMVSATISVGAVLLPAGASSSQEAMLRADETLERARECGRDGFAIYVKSPQREKGRLRLMSIADELVAALRDERLVFAYQPIVECCSRKPAHYECLLRMKRTDGTIMAAGHFIPAAEQLGLVRLVDRRAVEMAVAQLQAYSDITLAVNVSGTAASDLTWLQCFVEFVQANHGVASRLIVELTETAALHHFEENARFVSQLRELGCRVAIDDFGAGYTSFRNLQMLHADTVKIDGTFIKHLSSSPENQIFVRTLVHLAKSFNLKTVAEWVGSEEDAALLENFGVDYFQGYHFGEPQLTPVWMQDKQ